MRNPAKTRTCAGCGKKADKSEFIRIGANADGVISVADGGRGAYICKSASCLEKAIKRKRIQTILRRPVAEEIFTQISNIIGCDQN